MEDNRVFVTPLKNLLSVSGIRVGHSSNVNSPYRNPMLGNKTPDSTPSPGIKKSTTPTIRVGLSRNIKSRNWNPFVSDKKNEPVKSTEASPVCSLVKSSVNENKNCDNKKRSKNNDVTSYESRIDKNKLKPSKLFGNEIGVSFKNKDISEISGERIESDEIVHKSAEVDLNTHSDITDKDNSTLKSKFDLNNSINSHTKEFKLSSDNDIGIKKVKQKIKLYKISTPLNASDDDFNVNESEFESVEIINEESAEALESVCRRKKRKLYIVYIDDSDDDTVFDTIKDLEQKTGKLRNKKPKGKREIKSESEKKNNFVKGNSINNYCDDAKENSINSYSVDVKENSINNYSDDSDECEVSLQSLKEKIKSEKNDDGNIEEKNTMEHKIETNVEINATPLQHSDDDFDLRPKIKRMKPREEKVATNNKISKKENKLPKGVRTFERKKKSDESPKTKVAKKRKRNNRILDSSDDEENQQKKNLLKKFSSNSSLGSSASENGKTKTFGRGVLSVKKDPSFDILTDDEDFMPLKHFSKSKCVVNLTKLPIEVEKGAGIDMKSLDDSEIEEQVLSKDADKVNVELEPKDVTSQNSLREEVYNLECTVHEKREKLEELERVLHYKELHNIEDLQRRTSEWKRGCKSALEQLLIKLKENAPTMDLKMLLARLRINPDTLDFDEENDCFK